MSDELPGLVGVEESPFYDDQVYKEVSKQLASKLPDEVKPEPIKEKEQTKELLDVDSVDKEPEREFNELEKEALKYNWDPNGEKGAEEWLRARPLYQEIKESHRKIRDQDLTIGQLSAIVKQLKDRADEVELNRIKSLRAQAIQNRDVAQVEKLDEELFKFKSAPVNSPPQPPSLSAEDAVLRDNFKAKHASALNGMADKDVGEFLLMRDRALAQLGLPVKTHLKMLENEAAELFPNYTIKAIEDSTPTRQGSAKVSSDEGRVRAQTKNKSFDSLNKVEKQVAQFLERRGYMKRDEYVKVLNLSKEDRDV